VRIPIRSARRAIFGIPIAAVLSALLLHSIGRNVDGSPVAARAAERLGKREGREVRVPREPDPATDADVEPQAGAPEGPA